MRFAVVIEKCELNYSGCVHDLPGCIATGATVEAVEQEMTEAIRIHITASRRTATPCRSR